LTEVDSPHTEPENAAHGYCIALYDALKKRAKNGTFTGSATEVYNTLGISNQYYSKCFKALVEVGAVEYIQRGHHKRPTIYKLIHRPTAAQLAEYDFLTPASRRAKVSEEEMLRRLIELERRVQNVDIVAAFTNLEARIVALEKRK